MMQNFANSPYKAKAPKLPTEIRARKTPKASAKTYYPRGLNRFLVGLFFLGIYLNPFEAHQPIPFLISMLSAAILYIECKGKATKQEWRCVLFLLSIALISTTIAPRPDYLFARAKSMAYFAASVLASFIVFLEMRRWPRILIAKYAGIGSVVLLGGAGIEMVSSFIQEISDAYRFWNFRIPYDNDLRDIIFHGEIRPKFFSAEPSHLGRIFSLMLLAWFFTSRRRKRLFFFLVAMGSAIFIMRTPTLLILPAATLFYLFSGPAGGIFARMDKETRIIIGTIFGFFVATIFVALFWMLSQQRITQIISGNDPSAAVRLWFSFTIVPKLLAYNPITGIGVGGMEAFVHDIIIEHYSQVGPWLIRGLEGTGRLEHLVQNFPSNFIASFGLLGSALGLLYLIKFQTYVAKNATLIFWSLFFLYSLTTAALNGLLTWVVFFSFLIIFNNKRLMPQNQIEKE